MIDVKEAFYKYRGEFLKGNIKRPDLQALKILDGLVPGKGNIIDAAEHDKIFLGIDIKKLAQAATEDDIQLLVRCGVLYNTYYDSLYMLV